MEECSGTQADKGLLSSGGFQGFPGLTSSRQTVKRNRKSHGRFSWPDLPVGYVTLPTFQWPELHHMASPVMVYGKRSPVVWPGRKENPLDEVVSAISWKESWPFGQNVVSGGVDWRWTVPRPRQEGVPTDANSTQRYKQSGLESRWSWLQNLWLFVS